MGEAKVGSPLRNIQRGPNHVREAMMEYDGAVLKLLREIKALLDQIRRQIPIPPGVN
jgi:hypothetical protein